MDFKQYISELNQQYRTGVAREHSYRPALKDLLQALLPKMVVTNEPAHIECGAPDYIVSRKKDNLPVFFVEAKDVGDTDLDGKNKKLHKEQFDRYKQALDFIIFTDYLDFHLYEYGEFIDSVRIAEIKGSKIIGIPEAEEKFNGMIQHLGSSAIQSITSAPRLAKLMAGKARLLANIIEKAMNDETHSYENDNLQGQYNAFKDVLIQDLKKEDFADIYAQTIAYGMFAARFHDNTPEDFSREEAARLIPKTNPFLRQIFNNLAGNDLDERIAWVVDDLVTVFKATDLKSLMANYSKNKLHHDPMIHFYEDFLSEYNPKLRKSKGVWYTPQPVVSFIVRAVDEILQKEFELKDGLADYSMIEREVAVEQSRDRRTTDGMKHINQKFHRVQILDPATGTGTFLAEVVNQIYDRYRNNQGIWQQYVENHLLPRLNGFEILMASYAVAHIKLDMLLGETGYQHKTDKRLHVYLTNSLEESNNEPRTLFAQWLSREATEANVIKRDYPVMVMIGNPPYSGESQNGKLGEQLIAKFKLEPGTSNNIPDTKWLNSDEVKFIGLAMSYINRNNTGGIIGFINPHTYLDGQTFRGMRWQLLNTFDKIYIVNLHGNTTSGETKHSKDENVFDIRQGVCVNILVKNNKKEKGKLAEVKYCSLYGLTRQEKYDTLDSNQLESIGFETLEPKAPYYFFVHKDFAEEEGYKKGFAINKLFVNSGVGICSKRDKIAFQDNKEELIKVLNDFKSLPENEIKEKYKITSESRDQKVAYAKANIERYGVSEELIHPILYRPFDIKWTYFTNMSKGFIAFPVYDLMKHLAKGGNIALVANSSIKDEQMTRYFVSNSITDLHILETANANAKIFPLYIYQENMGSEERIVNFNKDLYEEIAKRLNYLPCYDDNVLVDPTSEYDGVLYPQDLFDYIYAVLHSPSYRERYKEFLKIDFPRIPYPTDWERFRDLVEKGEELRHLHLMEDLPNTTGVSYPISGSHGVDFCQWDNNRVYINSDQYFDGVPESAWNFYIGGYQPAQKWLKDRKGRSLDFNDIIHYGKIIYVLNQTGRIMKEIDEIQSFLSTNSYE